MIQSINELLSFEKFNLSAKIPVFITSFVIFLIAFIQKFYSDDFLYLAPIFFALFLVYQLLNTKNISEIIFSVFSIVYVAIPFVVAVLMIDFKQKIPFIWLISMFLFIWTFDIFSFFTGITLGKNKIAPNLSPKKTIEGFIGGIVFTLICGYLISKLFYISSPIKIISWALVVALSSFFGDLFESKIKRLYNLKDSGTIMPGHGGLLDRFDSFLFGSLSSYTFLKFFKIL